MKCTLCDERRVAEPAHYCDKACQKRHWPEHKAFHARLEIKEQRIRANARDPAEKARFAEELAVSAASSDEFLSLVARADQARLRGQYREAVKRAKKAIALEPDNPEGYFLLGAAYADSADFTNAVPQFLKTMELAERNIVRFLRFL